MSGQGGAAGPSACRIARFALVVTDIERAERFFAAAFGFTTTSRAAGDSGFADLVGVPGAMTRETHLRLGGQELVLIAYDHARPALSARQHQLGPVVPAPGHHRGRHRRGAGPGARGGPHHADHRGGPVRLPARPAARGRSNSVTRTATRSSCSSSMQKPPPRRGPGVSSGVFLGIDHAALAVADARRGVDFFRSTSAWRRGPDRKTAPNRRPWTWWASTRHRHRPEPGQPHCAPGTARIGAQASADHHGRVQRHRRHPRGPPDAGPGPHGAGAVGHRHPVRLTWHLHPERRHPGDHGPGPGRPPVRGSKRRRNPTAPMGRVAA